LLSSAPLSAQARAQIAEIQEAKIDYLPGLTSEQKKQRLSRISYEAFLRDVVHAEPAVLRFYHARTMSHSGAHGAHALQGGTAGARSEPRWARGAADDEL